MTLFYSFAERGFFDSGIHDSIPDDAVEVSSAKRREILNGVGRGKLVERADSGEPVLVDPVHDPEALQALERQVERGWRDTEFSRVQWLRDRHRDEQEQQMVTTLTDEQFAELLGYLQALRDWPQSNAFPASDSRPVAPPWIAEQDR